MHAVLMQTRDQQFQTILSQSTSATEECHVTFVEKFAQPDRLIECTSQGTISLSIVENTLKIIGLQYFENKTFID